MTTLLLQLSGPMQSWGVQSRFRVRDTGREPSKSGVVGLLCAALGRSRTKPVDDLAALRMGVRVDQEGRLLRDYHTAGKGGYLKASGTIERDTLITSTRYYLGDAIFLVGLECSNRDLAARLHAALRDPVWMLCLGRKAFAPGAPVWLANGLRDETLEDALHNYPWLGRRSKGYEGLRAIGSVRVVMDDDHGDEVRPDWPFNFAERRFGPRRVSTTFYTLPPEPSWSTIQDNQESVP